MDEAVLPLKERVSKDEVAAAKNFIVVEPRFALKAPVVEASCQKVIPGIVSVSPEVFKIVILLKALVLVPPEIICGEVPLKRTVPELWVKVEVAE